MMSTPPLCTLAQLQDGTYDLADVAYMVDVVLVRADNATISREIEQREAEARRGR